MKSSFVFLLLLVLAFGRNSLFREPTRSEQHLHKEASAPQKRSSGGGSRRFPRSFDYVVVGAGVGGCVVASRLSEQGHSVLLIEAGEDQEDLDLVSVPLNWDVTPRSPLDYVYVNSGEPVIGFSTEDRLQAAGKALGGSSTINTMMYVRGNKDDFNLWGQENPGWSYEEVLPYFKSLENSDRWTPDSQFHGNSGPLRVTNSVYNPPEDLLSIEAAFNAFGLNFTSDYNGDQQIGSGFHEFSIDGGERNSAYRAFIKPFLDRPRLFIAPQSLATRINFDSQRRAKEVEYVDFIDGVTYTARVRQEIIIACGALRTPQLLLLSGVGPSAELAELGVETVYDLPGVGKNLHDHPAVGLGAVTGLPETVGSDRSDPAVIAEYEANRTGILGSIGARVNLFFQTSEAVDDRPDAQTLVTLPGSFMFGFTYLLHPQSRGEVKLFSTNPTDRPLSTLNYFTEAYDLLATRDFLRKVHSFLSAPPLNGFVVVGPTDINDDASVDEYILQETVSGYHFVGSAKMGPSSDPTAVVDHRLRVHGIQNVRVADASIMPSITSGNTQAPTYMIGEKAAAMILEDNA